MNKPNTLRRFSIFLISLGIFFLFLTAGLIFQRTTPMRLAFASTPEEFNTSSINTSQTPARMIIDSINVDLPVIPTRIENNKWQVTSQGISYLTTSALPGEEGNAIFYGHNWTNLLGNLKKVKPGQKITIVYDDFLSKDFIIDLTQEVSPLNTEILNQTEDKRITIYTCSSFLDSKRFVVVASLSE